MRHTFALAALLVACSACASTVNTQPPPANEEPTRVDEMRRVKVYDAQGQAKTCEKPVADCASISPDRELADRCSLGGFRMVQCGCEMLCTGNTTQAKQYYDAQGNAKACAPVTADCEQPPASAAFQDACTEKGHKLEACGCEWLCSGNPTK